MDESLAGAQATGCHDHPFEKVLATCSDRFGGADAMIQFITNALDSVKHLSDQEASWGRCPQEYAVDFRSPSEKLCNHNLGPRHWGEILVERPQLFMRVLSALDQSFATGRSPEEVDKVLDNIPSTKSMINDTDQGELEEKEDPGAHAFEAESFVSPLVMDPLDIWVDERLDHGEAEAWIEPGTTHMTDPSSDDALWATSLFDTLYEISGA